jgi:hypothetical protein
MVYEVLNHTFLIVGFVFVMMLVVEYLNVSTRGKWDRFIAKLKLGQSALGAFLGFTPGCLGSFAVGSLYAHRIVTVGTITATMVATCGDEAFIMLALFPGPALLLMVSLLLGGIVTGVLVDLVLGSRRTRLTKHLQEYRSTHEEKECISFSRQAVLSQWQHCTPHRGWLTVLLVLFLVGVMSGRVGHYHVTDSVQKDSHAEHFHDPAGHMGEDQREHEEHGREAWNWVSITLVALTMLGLAVVVTVPDHFLDEHLWHHIVRVHLPRIFFWTAGALAVTHAVLLWIDVAGMVESHRIPVLLLACLIGLVPASGPHLVFVTLYAQGAVPFSTLLASCIVQDGHGMIPVLAHSQRAFVAIKGFKFLLGLSFGILGHLMGW